VGKRHNSRKELKLLKLYDAEQLRMMRALPICKPEFNYLQGVIVDCFEAQLQMQHVIFIA